MGSTWPGQTYTGRLYRCLNQLLTLSSAILQSLVEDELQPQNPQNTQVQTLKQSLDITKNWSSLLRTSPGEWRRNIAEGGRRRGAVLYDPVHDASCVGGKIQWIQAPLPSSCSIKPKLMSWKQNSQQYFKYLYQKFIEQGRRCLV